MESDCHLRSSLWIPGGDTPCGIGWPVSKFATNKSPCPSSGLPRSLMKVTTGWIGLIYDRFGSVSSSFIKYYQNLSEDRSHGRDLTGLQSKPVVKGQQKATCHHRLQPPSNLLLFWKARILPELCLFEKDSILSLGRFIPLSLIVRFDPASSRALPSCLSLAIMFESTDVVHCIGRNLGTTMIRNPLKTEGILQWSNKHIPSMIFGLETFHPHGLAQPFPGI